MHVLGRCAAADDRERAAEAGEERPVIELAPDVEPRSRGDGLVEARRGLEVGDPDPEVIDAALLPQRAVVYGLGAVAVRIEEECAVVVVAVLRPQAGRAVVGIAGVRSRLPERVDVGARRRCEPDVQAPRHRPVGARRRETEVDPLDVVLIRVGLLDPERLQHGLVELLRGCAVRSADRHVVEHSAGRLATATGAAGLVTCPCGVRIRGRHHQPRRDRARASVRRCERARARERRDAGRPGLARGRGRGGRDGPRGRQARSLPPATPPPGWARGAGRVQASAAGRPATRPLVHNGRGPRACQLERDRGVVRTRRAGRAFPRPRRREGLRRSRRRPARPRARARAHGRLRGSGRRQGADRRSDAVRVLGRARRARSGRSAGLGGGATVHRSPQPRHDRRRPARDVRRRHAARLRRDLARNGQRLACATTSTASAGTSRATTTRSRSGTSIAAACSHPWARRTTRRIPTAGTAGCAVSSMPARSARPGSRGSGNRSSSSSGRAVS